LKVAQLLYSGLGGHGSVAFSLIAGDRGRTWSNALCFVGIEPLLPAYRAQCEQLGCNYSHIPTRSGQPWRSWRGVWRWLQAERPDALIVHSSTVLPPCLAYARRQRIPLIVVEHQSVSLKRRRDWLMSAIAMRFTDRVVMLSASFADAMRTRMRGSYRASTAAVIPNGVDTNMFMPASQPPAGPVRIGMAARFTPSKRHELLVEVVRRLNERSPKTVWQLTFAGTGQTCAAVRQLADDMGESVAFEGFLDEGQLADWYRSLTVYALVSDGEAFSTSILQAMASGLPVVASDVDGIRDQVRDEFGRLLTNDDADAWVTAILDIAGDAGRRRALGANARRLCEQCYSAEAMHRAYDQLIREVAIGRLPGVFKTSS
jgi:glycosyltransferase involved in cell wall biosynthesis